MCSGNGTNFENILRSCNQDEVVLMIHNKKKCGAVRRAEKFGIPHCYVSHKNEDQMIKLFELWNVDLIVLAGYMRILSPKFFMSVIILFLSHSTTLSCSSRDGFTISPIASLLTHLP